MKTMYYLLSILFGGLLLPYLIMFILFLVTPLDYYEMSGEYTNSPAIFFGSLFSMIFMGIGMRYVLWED